MRNYSDEAQLGYLAGMMDGEGCFNACFDKNLSRYRLRCTIVNTNLFSIDFIGEILDKHEIKYSRYVRTCKSGKLCYSIQVIRNDSIKKYVDLILPYLVIKREHAYIFKFMFAEPDNFTEHLNKLRELNFYRGRKRLNKDQLAERVGAKMVGWTLGGKEI